MYGIDQSVIDRVISRRGKLHCFDSYQASRCALVVIDLQNYFMAPGHMAAVASAPAIVDTVNQAAKASSGGAMSHDDPAARCDHASQPPIRSQTE